MLLYGIGDTVRANPLSPEGKSIFPVGEMTVSAGLRLYHVVLSYFALLKLSLNISPASDNLSSAVVICFFVRYGKCSDIYDID